MDEEIFWYKCPNDACLLWNRPVWLIRGEEPICAACGWMLSACYPEIEGLA